MADNVDVSQIVNQIMPLMTGLLNLFLMFKMLQMMFGMMERVFTRA